MPEPVLSPARQLLAAIAELVAFVAELSSEPHGPLDEQDRRKLPDFEGRVVGLLAKVADGRIPFQGKPVNPSRNVDIRYTETTGVSYHVTARGMFLNPDHRWQDKMRALKAAVQTVIDLEAADGQSDKKPDAKKKRNIRGEAELWLAQAKASASSSKVSKDLKKPAVAKPLEQQADR